MEVFFFLSLEGRIWPSFLAELLPRLVLDHGARLLVERMGKAVGSGQWAVVLVILSPRCSW